MGTWTSVSKLTLTLETGQQEGLINDELGVVISVQPTDDNGDVAEVDTDTLYKRIKLVDFVDASPLSWDTASQWYWKLDPGFQPNPGMTPQIKYIVCKNNPDLHTRSFGVYVETDSGKRLYSSQNGVYRSSVLMQVP